MPRSYLAAQGGARQGGRVTMYIQCLLF